MSSALVAAGPPQVVRVKREVLAACMTCPLCHKLLRDATTISECLHTFCRKCIFDKLTDEDAECCPICNIDLGCVPEEKLRPDHNLQDVRAKIFPYKKKKFNGPEVVPSVTFPVRRKERSLSSLVVNTPRMGAHLSFTGRRTKAVVRRASTLRGLNPVIDEPKKENYDDEDVADSSSVETLRKMAHSRRQTSYAETSNHTPNEGSENSLERYRDKSELWKPLNCLVEAANRTKSIKSTPQIPAVKSEQTNGLDNDSQIYRTKGREHPGKLKMHDDKNNNVSTSSAMAKARKVHGVSRKRKELGPSAQAVLDAADAARERRICPIWLSLLSSPDQKGDKPLPQITTSYLRINVLFIGTLFGLMCISHSFADGTLDPGKAIYLFLSSRNTL